MKSRHMATVIGLIGAAAGVLGQEADFGFRAGYQRIVSAEDGSFLGGGFFRMAWHRVVFLEGAVYYHTDEFVTHGTHLDVESIPIHLSAEIYPLSRTKAWAPYFLGGVGLYVRRTTEEGVRRSKSEYDFGWHLGGGLDYVFWENVFVSADFRYLWLDTEIKGRTIEDTLKDFDSWLATVGLGFRL